jgi:UDP-N-acetylmuramoylalanine--D-glutamate ligase
MMKELLSYLESKSILILGFGLEGKSTYRFLIEKFPERQFTIADRNTETCKNAIIRESDMVFSGEEYLEQVVNFDLIIKSPGIRQRDVYAISQEVDISSQTDLIFRFFSKQSIGITGTKGKSTTSSLIYYLLNGLGKEAALVGNIGKPAFDLLQDYSEKSFFVYELSSHQLQSVKHAPHFAILLNYFQEHLDYYRDYSEYKEAKYNITKYQKAENYFIFDADDGSITNMVADKMTKASCYRFSYEKGISDIFVESDKVLNTDNNVLFDMRAKRKLIGKHNEKNIMAALLLLQQMNIETSECQDLIENFNPLEHRLEFVVEKNGILFYNDSIATIPEASIAAIQALKKVETIILGGFDRGIFYDDLISFLASREEVKNIIFMGEAGERMREIFRSMKQQKKDYFVSSMEEAVSIAIDNTTKTNICLLSPAASSYDTYNNFEERGRAYKKIACKV